MAGLPRLLSVSPGDAPCTIDVVWENGGAERIDMTGVITREPAFAALRDPAAFRQVRLAQWGWGIEWPMGLDYAPDTLFRLAEAQRPMTADDFRAWQLGLGLSNRETADLLDRGVSTIKSYRNGETAIPRSVALACRAMARDAVTLSALYRPRHAGKPPREAA
ncbi:MAG: DUF2442 domain-containing protein [Alphaproteobacteria bacterium]|nr:DUF2442 domain-containing protein [Alphaproteobacteria bacterium]